ncbi:hypothetical protein GUITHDRAFT_148170 [Guillardia theta CCMP2712]|uniref:Uncharacterized protein n=1 Tax=Guillardia theta (strain CCMP2712) TaxID=905079 RepID=L1IA30_GUITC|nr:hypothetical protein GUITHDRAFT_148170 [Guillardia theta CCMP2712]EKX33111.1 hypothetical protein GUITHDRAFT_148170 [Guillardia theta CCMP2712]|eukprot:XP_005820091.1 hypothetical protein GUITHDRAFT_148170 [Guillardia theta CCMP2712]
MIQRMAMLGSFGCGALASFAATYASKPKLSYIKVDRKVCAGGIAKQFLSSGAGGFEDNTRRKVAVQVIKNVNACVFCTNSAEGAPRCRVLELQQDSRASMTYFDPENAAYVFLAGRVQVVGKETLNPDIINPNFMFSGFKPPGKMASMQFVPLQVEVISPLDGMTGDKKSWIPPAAWRASDGWAHGRS